MQYDVSVEPRCDVRVHNLIIYCIYFKIQLYINYYYILGKAQPRGLVVRVSDY